MATHSSFARHSEPPIAADIPEEPAAPGGAWAGRTALPIQLGDDQRQRQRGRGMQRVLDRSWWRALVNELVPLGTALRQQAQQESRRRAALDEVAQQLREAPFHRDTVGEVYARMGTAPATGLDAAAVERRRAQQGRNVVGGRRRLRAQLRRVCGWFFGGFNRFLWVSVVVFFLCWKPIGNPPQPGNLALAVVIVVIICMQALFAAWQEWVTSRTMEAIGSMVPEAANVLRSGRELRVAPAELVDGDVVLLRAGDLVPADMRIVAASVDLVLDRSALTGTAQPALGSVGLTSANYLETRNMALMGAAVTQGTCRCVVVATGERTVLGRLGRLVELRGGKTKQTILQLEVRRLVNALTTVSLVVGVAFVVLWAAWLRHAYPGFMSVSDALANGVGVLVTFVPGSLPVSLTLALTAVARRMQRHRVLITSLAAVETLGTVGVLCCEKTGTLTQRRAVVTRVAFADAERHAAALHADGGRAAQRLYETAAWCNDAVLDADAAHLPAAEREATGDATDCALLRMAARMAAFGGLAHQRLLTVPFSLRSRWMLTVCRSDAQPEPYVLVKGAPETLLPRCAAIQNAAGEVVALDAAGRARLADMQRRWADEGCRVLLLCRRDFGAQDNPLSGLADSPAMLYAAASACVGELTVVGLVGMVDPPRPEIPGVVDTFRRAGVRVFMVTGDYAPTAAYVARQCRIITAATADSIDSIASGAAAKEMIPDEPKPEDLAGNAKAEYASDEPSLRRLESRTDSQHTLTAPRALVVSGPELRGLSTDAWDRIAGYEEIVFARITPEQKLQIVEELRARDTYVAVTGDDVNDLPAMHAANVAVAMGSGSEVAKAAADIVLLDNSLSSVVVAVECGRLVFVNLKKVIVYLLPMTNLSEIMPSFLNVVLGLPIPLSTFLMLVINTVTDVWASVVLINEEPEDEIMLKPPRNPRRERLVDLRLFVQAYGFIGIIQTLTGHVAFFLCLYLRGGISPRHVFLAFNKWSGGYLGHSKEDLAHLVAVAGSAHFMALVIMQWGNMFVARTRTVSVFRQNPLWGPTSNPLLLVAVPLSILVALFFNEITWFNTVFLTGKIPVEFFFIPVPFAFALVAAEELRKLVVRRYPRCWVARIAW
ncbi:hypothetical protein GGI15_003557 [Coemansia interrupta]|uniref:Cation-transporting P-type ATPase N-terminal domain-containing protein n=1 Tax=Coemansia interrupta TaxID=1126814 RepID=A0A9W8H8Y6_9FUNG|nr:hypothetical protein GGI15_003557 [Coemansia interrupta]